MENLAHKIDHENGFKRNMESQDETTEPGDDTTHVLFAEMQSILDAASFLKPEENPVAARADKKGLAYALEQYSLLPLHIIDMLKLAKKAARWAGWEPVVTEFNRNIGQERGSDSEGVSHYRILAQAMQSEFGINLPHAAREATDTFIHSTKELLRNPNPYFVMGVAYALESSAVPELEVVLSFIKKLAGDRPLHEPTKSFFDKHLNTWEPSHESELRQAVAPFIATEQNMEAMRQGFTQTIEAMRIWWNKLAEEAEQIEKRLN